MGFKVAPFGLAMVLAVGLVRPSQASDITDQLRGAYDTSVNFKAGTSNDFESWADENQIQTSSEAWAKLQRSDWMFWLIEQRSLHAQLDKAKMRLFVCDCAEQALPTFERQYPGDKRLRQALEVARNFSRGKATALELKAASKKVASVVAAAKKAELDAAKADGQPNLTEIEGASNAAAVVAAATDPDWYRNSDALDEQKMANDTAKEAAVNLAKAIKAAAAAEAHAKAVVKDSGSDGTVDAQEATKDAADAESAVSTAQSKATAAKADAVGAAAWCITRTVAWYAQCAAEQAVAVAQDESQLTGAQITQDSLDSAVATAKAWQADKLRFYFPDVFTKKP